MKNLYVVYLSVVVLLLSGCGKSSDPAPAEPKVQSVEVSKVEQGVFLDSPVQGLGFRYESHNGLPAEQGVTDAAGTFNYIPGKTIVFSVGNLDLPETIGKAIITPLDLIGTDDLNDPAVVNILRLLQTLDANSNPDDGIVIEAEEITFEPETPIAFESETFALEIQPLIEEISEDPALELIAEEQAISHFEETLETIRILELFKNGIRGIGDQRIEPNETFSVDIRVTNETVSTDEITLSITSDNQSLFPDANIGLSTTGQIRSLSITPATDLEGVGQFTLTLQNSVSRVSKTFSITVAVPTPPPAPTEAQVFSRTLISSQQFAISSNFDQTENISFDNNGTGTITTNSQVNAIDWSINSNGQLEVTEFDGSNTNGPVKATWVIAIDDYDSNGSLVTRATVQEDSQETSGEWVMSFSPEDYSDYLIDLRDFNGATSIVTRSGCSSEAGFAYSFSETELTRIGTDSIDPASCEVGEAENQNFVMSELAADFDLPFNCVNYPICNFSDLNKLSADESVRYSHLPGTKVIEYVDAIPDSSVVTEIITLSDPSNLAFTQEELEGRTLYAVFIDDDCGGWVRENLSFSGNQYTAGATCDGGNPEVGTFDITNSGVLRLIEPGEFIQRVSYDQQMSAYVTCWADSEAESAACTKKEYLFSNQTIADGFVEQRNNPSRLSYDFLAGRTFYDAWYGRDDFSPGDTARLARLSFSDDGRTVTFEGLIRANSGGPISINLTPEGLMYGDNPSETSRINPCGVTEDYVELIYEENGIFDNIDRFYFRQADAEAYVASLNASIPQTPCDDTPLAFTESELQSAEFYSTWRNDEGCEPLWITERISFDGANYSLELCHNEELETGSYEVLDSGILRLVEPDEYIRRVSYNPISQAYSVCWARTELEALQCQADESSLLYTDKTIAEQYALQQNIRETSIYGVWRQTQRPVENTEAPDALFIVNLPNQTYFFAESNNLVNGNDFEFGSFNYDQTVLSYQAQVDTNAIIGPSGFDQHVSLNSTRLWFETNDPSESGDYVFSKEVFTSSNQIEDQRILGAWQLVDQDTLFVFLADGHYLGFQPFEENSYVGFEYGEYQYDGQTLNITTTNNNDGDALLCDNEDPNNCSSILYSANVTGDDMMISFPATPDGPANTFSFVRVDFSANDTNQTAEINYHTIATDGNANDWAQITAVAIDPAGDQQGSSSTDITGLSVARDEQRLHLLMSFEGPANLYHTPSAYSHYEIAMTFYDDSHCEGADNGFLIVNHYTSDENEANFVQGIDGYFSDDTLSNGAPITSSIANNNLEVSFDLATLPTNKGQFVSFSPYVQSFDSSGNATLHDEIDNALCLSLPIADLSQFTWAVFDPAQAKLPIPNDLMYDAVADGSFSIPDSFPPVTSALNELSGASTIAPIDIALSGLIDASSLDARPYLLNENGELILVDGNPVPNPDQNVFLLELSYASFDPMFALSAAEPPTVNPASGDDYTAEIKTLDGVSVVRIHPKKPLKPYTRYLVTLTNSLLDADGGALIRSPGISGYGNLADTNQALPNPALGTVRNLIVGLWEPIAQAYFDAATNPVRQSASQDNLTSENIVLSYSFTTSADERVLSYIADPTTWFVDGFTGLAKQSAIRDIIEGNIDMNSDNRIDYADMLLAASSAVNSFPIKTTDPDDTAFADTLAPYEVAFSAVGCEGVTQGVNYIDCIAQVLTSLPSSSGGFADVLPTPKAQTIDFPDQAATTLDLFDVLHPDLSSAYGITAGQYNIVQGHMSLPYYSGLPTDIGSATEGDNKGLGTGTPLMQHHWVADKGLATSLNTAFAGLGLNFPQADPTQSTVVNALFPFPQQQDGDVTTPDSNDNLTVPVLAIYPTAAIGPMRTAIWSHGLQGSRTDGISFGAGLVSFAKVSGVDLTFLAIDQPLHGLQDSAPFMTENERHFGYTYGGLGFPPVAIESSAKGSGTMFTNLENLLTSRDNNRQHVLDLLTLRKSISSIDFNTGEDLPDPDGENVFFIGHGLGATNTPAFVAIANETTDASDDISAAAFYSPSGGLSRLLENSGAYAPSITDALATSGLTYDTNGYQLFFNTFQAALDAVDATNFFEQFVEQESKVLVVEAVNDFISPVSLSSADRTLQAPAGAIGNATEISGSLSYLSGTEPLIGLVQAQALNDNGTYPLERTAIRYNACAAQHEEFSTPGSAAFAENLGQAVSMVVSNGTSITVQDPSLFETNLPLPLRDPAPFCPQL